MPASQHVRMLALKKTKCLSMIWLPFEVYPPPSELVSL